VQKLTIGLLGVLPLGLLGAVACGGSAFENGAIDQTGGGAGASGKSSIGGSASAGTSGAAGSTNAGGSAAGGAQGGDGGGANNAGAGGIGCAVACPGIVGTCAGGYHYGTAAGQCCPSCIPDSTNDCAQGQINYQDFEQSQIGFSDSCKTDRDCVLAPEINACVATCGIPISTSAAMSVVSALRDYALNNCSACTPPTPPPCAGFGVSCINGACKVSAPIM
jgi:hypothetical protein